MGGWLDWVILWVFSNLGDSMILFPSHRKEDFRTVFLQTYMQETPNKTAQKALDAHGLKDRLLVTNRP